MNAKGSVFKYPDNVDTDLAYHQSLCDGKAVRLHFLTEIRGETTPRFQSQRYEMFGIGKCGRCNVGNKYICKDGPVFRMDELQELPSEY